MSDIYWLNKDSRTFLGRDYLPPNITPEQRIRDISERAEKTLSINGFADKFESYMHKGWYSLATPIWTNFGLKRGLPISCFGSYVPDSTDEILRKAAEAGIMSKNGGGTSAYFGGVRHRGSDISTGGKTDGPIRFMEIFDSITNVINQCNTRRGQCVGYLPVEHPDIEEFLRIRTEGHAIQHMSIGVSISDSWMNLMVAGDKQKRSIWSKIIRRRFESGYPYVFFSDTVNRHKPQVYKDKGLTIWSSNLCTEICEATNEFWSFVCCLASLNLLHWDEWHNTDAVQILAYFLDAVMSEFIEKTENMKFMEDARRFAIDQRAIGIGALGWHSYLQKNMIPFESMGAKYLTTEIFKYINDETLIASKKMAEQYGEPPLLKGYGERNVTRMAVAPNTNSSFVLGQVSPSIEPYNSNYFVKDLDKGKFTFKNPYLGEVLKKHNKNNKETWDNILIRGGSVQHLDFLSQEERDVFKTFLEISQKEIIIQASIRQKFIDQSQSINLMVHPNTPPKEVSELMIEAWRLGVKTLYYQRGQNLAKEIGRKSLLECKSCES